MEHINCLCKDAAIKFIGEPKKKTEQAGVRVGKAAGRFKSFRFIIRNTVSAHTRKSAEEDLRTKVSKLLQHEVF